MTNILNWFRYNAMKANPDEFQFMILGLSDDKCFILKINVIEIRNTSEVGLLGLIIYHKLKFDPQIDKLCKTARFKLHVLRRIRKFLTLEQAKLLPNSFVNTHFGYAPLILQVKTQCCKQKQATLTESFCENIAVFMSRTIFLKRLHHRCLILL